MPLKVRSATNFQDEAYQFIKRSEAFRPDLYGDPLGIPTIGDGYALAVKDSKDVWSLKPTLAADFASIGITLTSGQLFTLNAVVRALNSGNALRAGALSNTLGNQAGSGDVRLITEPEGRTLFNVELQRALDVIQARFRRFLGDVEGNGLFTRLQGSKEMVALASMAYNVGTTIGPGLTRALQANDRAEAWFQIRYNTNSVDQDASIRGGIANRRYRESDQFGLYDEGTVTEQHARDIYRMFTRHREQILNYEQTFSPTNVNAGSTSLQSQFSAASNLLLAAAYTQGIQIAWDHIYVGENDGTGGNSDSRYYSGGRANGDIDVDLRGSNENDLMFADSGNDRVSGGDGQDVIYGGSGNDTIWGGVGDDIVEGGDGDDLYYQNPGDGRDRIKDGSGNDLLVFDGGAAVGTFVRQVGETSYRTPNGRFTATVEGTSLLVTDTRSGTSVLLQEFANGQFGIQLRELNPLPDPTQFAPITNVSTVGGVRVHTGTTAAETTAGTTGDDEIAGNGGGDYLRGDAGADRIEAGADNIGAVLDGGVGRDVIVGSAGNDRIIGGLATDTGVSDDDAIQGGAGEDYIEGGWGNDYISGGEGRDTLLGGAGNDVIEGGGTRTAQNRQWTVTVTEEQPAPNQIIVHIAYDNFVGGATTANTIGDVAYGGDGADVILGGTGDDVFFGEAGSDDLFGGAGNDLLDGGEEADSLVGGAGDDRLFGGGGDDRFFGDAGNDYLDGGSGNDFLTGRDDNDTLSGGIGMDTLYGGAGSDVLYGDDGNDLLVGGIGAGDITDAADVLVGGLGDDTLQGEGGDDVLYGGEGKDILIGNAGADVLEGGKGDDQIFRDKDDTVVWRFGDGKDGIAYGDGPGGRLIIKDLGIQQIAIGFAVDPANGWQYLQLYAGDGSQQVGLQGGFLQWNMVYEINGEEYTQRDIMSRASAMSLNGTDQGDTIYGSNSGDIIRGYRTAVSDADGADLLIGQRGNDQLEGGRGDDIYRFALGDGRDTINDAQGVNRIEFETGVLASDVYLDIAEDGTNARIVRYSSSDQITLTSASYAAGLSLTFAGGSTLTYQEQTGTTANDTLSGTDGADALNGASGNDTLNGGAGNDSLIGGVGADVLTGGTGSDLLAGGDGSDRYFFNRGDGHDLIRERGWSTSDYDTITFGAGIVLSDLSFSGENNDLVITIAGGDDRIVIDDWFVNSMHRIDNLIFANSSQYSIGTRANLVAVNAGTGGNDVLYGDTSGSITVAGYEGNDTLNAAANGSVLDGGLGNDTLNGAAGNDTYLFLAGDGQDVVRDTGGAADQLVLSDLNRSEVTFARSVNDLIVRVDGSTDLLTIKEWWASDTRNQIETVTFADGTRVTAAEINQLGLAPVGTGANDSLYSGQGNDTAQGGDGNDLIDLGPGHDTIDGDAGDDRLFGSYGDDVIRGGTGKDELYGEANDDRLEGGEDNDLMVGGLGSDTLDGGAGNDELYGNADSASDGKVDTFLFGRGSGLDEINAHAEDRLVFSVGIGAQDVSLSRSGYDLIVNIAGSSDRVTLVQWFAAPASRLSTFVFADGSSLPSAESIYQSLLTYSGTAADDTQMYGNDDSEVIRGLGGNDSIFGGAGNDRLEGGQGNDRLDAGTGADQLYGEEGDDQLYARTDDLLDGGVGNDTLEGGNGSTYVFGRGYGQDSIRNYKSSSYDARKEGFVDRVLFTSGTTASDIVFSRIGNDLILTIAGTSDVLAIRDWFSNVNRRVDRFDFADGTSLPSPTEITDRLLGSVPAEGIAVSGTTGADSLSGTAGAETLYGLDGNDTLAGGGGDLLVGGAGNDDYLFARGNGAVSIYDYDVQDAQAGTATDRVMFAAGIAASDLELRRTGNDLVLALTGGTDQLTVRNWFAGANYRVDFAFADGSSLPTAEQIYASLLNRTGTSAADTIEGYEANDTLSGLDGDDWLLGAAGDDTLYGGAGRDSLDGEAGNDTLFGGADTDWLTGSSGNDVLYGGGGSGSLDGGDGNDTLDGGVGGATESNSLALYGGTGNDTYIFGRGYGVHRIDESGSIADRDRVLFASDVTLADVTIARWDRGISIAINGTPDKLYIESYTDLRLIFGDGTELTARDVESATLTQTGDAAANEIRAFAGSDVLYGLGGADRLYGGNGSDVIYGGEGNDLLVADTDAGGLYNLEAHGNDYLYGEGGDDTLQGWAGDDVLDGGTGNDSLVGGSGNDQYVYSLGSGQDVITDYDAIDADPYTYGTAVDRVVFGAGIQLDRLSVTRIGNDLNIRVNEADQLRIKDWFTGNAVEEFRFSDGSVLTAAQMQARIGAPISNSAPTLALPLADQATEEDSSFTYQLPQGTFVDADSGDRLTYSATLADGTPLPSWLTLDAATGTFSGTPSAAGTLAIIVTATDALGAQASDVFNLTIASANDAPVLVQPLADQNARDSSAFTYQVPSAAFADPDAGDTLTYSATLADGTALPTWLSFNASTRTFSGTPGSANVGTLQVRVIARDSGGAEASDVFNLAIADAAIYGTDAANTLSGTAEIDRLYGLAGNDVMDGLGGNDLLDGGTGDDTMRGGLGNDTYIVDSTLDTVTESSGQGTDLVRSQVSFTLGSNVENLTLTGSAAVNATGNTLANVLTGNTANNTLNGLTGADTLIGGAGDDTYVVDNASDSVVEALGEGVDHVQSGVTFTLSANVENLTLTGSSAINGTGNGENNVLTGNGVNNTLTGGAGNDTLNGGAGTDTMVGGSGNDTYVVAQTGDVVTENAGEGVDLVQSSISYSLTNNVENLTLTGTATTATGNALDNILTGNASNNTLTGNDGNDVLDGGAGTDSMSGGLGNDVYYVDVSGDTTTESAGQGIDTVRSGVARTLAANIELLFLTGTGNNAGTGNTLANLLRGNTGSNTLNGGGGIDILEGGDGADTLSNTTSPGNTLFNGGAGVDTLTGTASKDLLIGGAGNDAITTGSGADIIVFNKGQGQDTVAASTTRDNVVSLGGGTVYADLLFQKNANDLILKIGASDQITFTGYYTSATNRSVDKLQIILEGSSDYNAGSSDALRNKKIETFNFEGLFAAFESARAASPTMTTWALSNALTAQHLGGSDTAAIGGDLAYRYGRFGTLSDISFTPALGILGATGFATTAQTLQAAGSLQDASARLS